MINVWAAILNNLERNRSEGSLRRLFTPIDVMVNIYFFFTNTNDQITNDTTIKMQSTLDPLINTAKPEEARHIDFETILQREF